MKSWWHAVATYPPTWAAIALVILGVWAILAVLQPPMVLSVVLIALGGVAIVIWPITMSATGTLAKLQFEMPKLSEVGEQELAELEDDLADLDDPRPAHQLRAIREKRDNLVDMLDHRLEAGELTYARYLSTAQQVYLSVLDNLHEVAVAMASVSTIDDEYIDRRLEELESNVTNTESAEAEMSSLRDRRALRAKQEDRAADLLAQNESAMTLLDRTSSALADAPIGRTPQDAEAAMEALEELASRAGKYATG
jgi:hypothetical protein